MSSYFVDAIGEIQAKLADVQARLVEREKEVAVLQKKTDNTKKLTKTDVSQIRSMWANRGSNRMSQRDIGAYFDINRGTVSRIVNGKYHAG